MASSVEFGCWLVSGRSPNTETEAKEEKNILESLGLSSKFEDWLVEPGKIPDSCEQADEHPQEQEMVTEKTPGNSEEFFASVAVKRIEEIVSRGLQYWLCEPEINKKFDRALQIQQTAKGNLKRKMSNNANEMEEPHEKINKL